MPHLRNLFLKIDRLNKRARLLERGDRVLVAVSGGPDSIALLHLLTRLRRKFALTLAAAHVHHGLHKQNDEALRSVQKACRALGLPLAILKADVRKTAKREKRSLEEAGRMTRYAFFDKTARRLKMNKIATAHTMDDQAETLLMRISRGCGLRGLTGIPGSRKEGNTMIIRPLLGCRKKELLAFLKKERVPYLVDRSNKEEIFTRNRVRAKLIPWLEKNLNISVKEALSDLQDSCERAQRFLEKSAERKFNALTVKRRKDSVGVPAAALYRLDPAILSEVLRRLYVEVRGDGNAIAAVHRFGMEELLGPRTSSSRLDLPGAIRARRDGTWLWIEKK